LALLCAWELFFNIDDASAQCAAQDVAGNRHLLAGASLSQTSDVVQSAAGTPVWKTIHLGTRASKWDLRRALEAENCSVGDTAEEIFAQSEFGVSTLKIGTDLVSVSLAQLGLQNATLRDIYARAQTLGFALAAAEVGPQLRLQYLEQPLGEFLNIGMTPIATTGGKRVIFAIGNGGDGLLLIGKAAGDAAEFHSTAQFVFVRRRNVASSQTKSD
jgi:hypothetical protein